MPPKSYLPDSAIHASGRYWSPKHPDDLTTRKILSLPMVRSYLPIAHPEQASDQFLVR
jgi:hypothetical protein